LDFINVAYCLSRDKITLYANKKTKDFADQKIELS
jgi:hypothetical protein